jgi:hypothetical protein
MDQTPRFIETFGEEDSVDFDQDNSFTLFNSLYSSKPRNDKNSNQNTTIRSKKFKEIQMLKGNPSKYHA